MSDDTMRLLVALVASLLSCPAFVGLLMKIGALKKLGFEDELRRWVPKAVSWVERLALKRLKNDSPIPLLPVEKMKMAQEFLREASSKLKKEPARLLEAAIEDELEQRVLKALVSSPDAVNRYHAGKKSGKPEIETD